MRNARGLLLVALVSAALAGCGLRKSGSGASQAARGPASAPGPSAATVTLADFRQVNESLSSSTGIPPTATGVINAYLEVRSQLAQWGRRDEIGDTQVKALVVLAGAYCQAAINNERAMADAGRKVFRGVNFGSATGLTDAAMSRIFAAFNVKQPSTEQGAELRALRAYLDGTSLSIDQKALVACTAAASTLSAYAF